MRFPSDSRNNTSSNEAVTQAPISGLGEGQHADVDSVSGSGHSNEYKVGALATKQGSYFIGPKQAARCFHAIRFATALGTALNFLITINTSSLGIPDKAAGAFIREVWGRLSRWWSYQRDTKNRKLGTFDSFLIHENPVGGPRHAHWLIRAPKGFELEIQKVIENRIWRLTDKEDLGRAIHFMNVPKPGGMAKYMLKGMNPTYASHFHTEAEFQGKVYGRRFTVSRSIGYTSRKKAGWSRKRGSPKQ